VRSPIRRRHVALAALSAGILITAGCGGKVSGKEAPDARELFLQTAGARGPDPFTASTAAPASRSGAVPRGKPGDTSAARSPAPDGVAASAARMARSLPGSTPGLYGGKRSRSSCDVERQVRLLTEDRGKARAFAKGAGIRPASLPSFLRGLTPVVLRADTRVTNHGFRGGSATSFQSVLQAGTAVMADDRGMPRVRCACGNPLRPAVAVQGAVAHRGAKWHGYSPGRVVVVQRAPAAVGGLVIVNAVDNTWIERRTGTDGDEDRVPDVMPPYDADADITDPDAVAPPGVPLPDDPSGAPTPSDPAVPTPSDPPSGRDGTPPPSDAPTGDTPPDAPEPSEPPSPDDPGLPPEGDLYPPMPDAQQTSIGLISPETYQS
jgi:hypothetical protein